MKTFLFCFVMITFACLAIADDIENFLTGTWLAQGVTGKTCTISDVGTNKMKFVNEKGEAGVGSFETFQSVIVDFPSAKGLKGEISNGNRINWSNGQVWVRASNSGEFANVPVAGSSTAPVTIVEYSDFQCPYCSKAHFTLNELLKQYDGKIKVAFKHYPLISIHPWSEKAAQAGICAFQQRPESFWNLADYFFTNQDKITPDTLPATLRQFAGQSNLNYSKLAACMADSATKEKIDADAAEAKTLQAGGTPFFTVNGKLVEGALPIDQFKQVIDQALAEVR
jgi:protein-disulfide isomerase